MVILQPAVSDRDAQVLSLGRAPLLDAEEERALAVRAFAGDVEARNALVRANVRLGAKIAYAFRGRGLALSDLIQEATIGLVYAAERFDPGRGFRFTTYAGHWVRQAVMRALADTGKTIRLPYNVVTELGRLRRADRDLRAELGRSPSVEELALAVDATIDRVLELLPRAREPRSLDEPLIDGGEDMVSSLPSLDGDDACDVLLRAEVVDGLYAVLDRLPARERRLIELRFGLLDDDPWTLEEIGIEMGVTRERIRQLEAVALERLRGLVQKPRRRARKSSPAGVQRAQAEPRRDAVEPSAAAKRARAARIDPLPEEVVGRCRRCNAPLVLRAGCSLPTYHPCRASATT